MTIQVITGSPATTGSETPPSPSEGWTPLYLVDLSYGQTRSFSRKSIKPGPRLAQACRQLSGRTIPCRPHELAPRRRCRPGAPDQARERGPRHLADGEPAGVGHVRRNRGHANLCRQPEWARRRQCRERSHAAVDVWDTTGRNWDTVHRGVTAIAVWSPVGIGNNVDDVTANATLTADPAWRRSMLASGDVVDQSSCRSVGRGHPLVFASDSPTTPTQCLSISPQANIVSAVISAD